MLRAIGLNIGRAAGAERRESGLNSLVLDGTDFRCTGWFGCAVATLYRWVGLAIGAAGRFVTPGRAIGARGLNAGEMGRGDGPG